jgi:beta-mannosidase
LAVGVVRKNKVNPRPNLQHEAFCKAKTKAEAAGVIAHATPHIYPPQESTYSVWVANSTASKRQLKVRVRFISIKTGKEKLQAIIKVVDVEPLGTTEVTAAETPEDEPTAVVATLLDEEDQVISRQIDWPQPLKHITFPDRGLNIDVHGEELIITASKPVKGLVLLNDGVQWSDNCLDISPMEEERVVAKGLTGEVKYIYYGM